jgi:hypothetical protein
MNQKITKNILVRKRSPFGEGFSLSELVANMRDEWVL